MVESKLHSLDKKLEVIIKDARSKSKVQQKYNTEIRDESIPPHSKKESQQNGDIEYGDYAAAPESKRSVKSNVKSYRSAAKSLNNSFH